MQPLRRWGVCLILGPAIFVAALGGCDALTENPEATAKCADKKSVGSKDCSECCHANGATGRSNYGGKCACLGKK